jgi:ABC-type transport system substrate-binding protein
MNRLAILIAGVLWLSWSAIACAETALYEVPPYDLITLDPTQTPNVLKIVPLPNRQPPRRGKPIDKLVVRLFDKPDTEYSVAWRSIVKIELFEQLVLNKANDLVADERFEDAYEYFTWLERNKSDTPGLARSIENSLYEEAKYCHRKKQFDGALALLREIHQHNPRRPGLDVAIGRSTDELVKQYVAAENYEAARSLLRNLSSDYSDHPVVHQWRDRLTKQAAPLLVEARAAADAGQWSKAGELTRRIAVIWPELPGARDLAKTVHKEWPRVIVGVSSIATDMLPNRLDDWSTRRTSRLLYRTLAEFAGASTEGGKYDCPVGNITLQSLNRQLAIRLKPGIGWANGNATLSNCDVARRLLAMANPGDPAYRVDWADLLLAVSTSGVDNIQVEFRRPHVRPEAMLQIVLTPHGAQVKPGEPPPVNGPFIAVSRTAEQTVFSSNTHYFASRAGQPKELVERRYPTINKAILAIKRGDVLILDRVNPWNLAALRADPHLVVQPYALPLIHCLIPNMRRPLTADRNFRRALAYGITRDAILQQMLGGADVLGCYVISGPFPRGLDPGDPMGYAYDDGIDPRPYLPRLAMALATVAVNSRKDADKPESKDAGKTETKDAGKPENKDAGKTEPKDAVKPVKKKLKKVPTLILAHPSDEIATAACASIQRQLKLVNIPVVLRPYDGPMPTRVPDDVDLLYAELPMWEPLIDARRVFGEDGMTGGCSPYMTLVLRQLDEAVDWTQVRDCLHRVHRIAFDDTAIVPLWQLVEYFVYRDSLGGIPVRPVSLYQNIEQWRPPFNYSAEK